MKILRTGQGLLLTVAIAAIAASPAAAEEAPLVPPENSAVNQYTEAFPTASGDKDAHERGNRSPSPKKVLGADKAKELRGHGPAGRATAELAAETAPVVEVTTEETDQAGAGVPARGGGPGNGTQNTAGKAVTVPVVVAEPDGSSGLSEVIGRATGSSPEGGMGIFLPLLIVATIFWAFAYLARQRRPVS